MADVVRVSVIYADAERQIEKWVDVAADSTVASAIRASGITNELPRDFTPSSLGIFGNIVSADHRVRAGDRIELYRPLHIDPKEARRQRARR